MEGTDPASSSLEQQLARLHEMSFGWAVSCCEGQETDAEDVLQTVYVKVLSGAARFEARSSFRTWLFGVIRMTAHEHRRREASLRRRADLMKLEVARSTSDPAPDPAVRTDVSERLRAALARLPHRQQEVLHLVFYQDLTLREAATVMGVSLGSARVHYHRGKRSIRVLLEESGIPGRSQ
jgi:RNA polymerase sigma-70 factor (ECF subfamily)